MDIKSIFSYIKSKDEPDELEFMTEVDAALHRRGNPWAYRLSIGLLVCFGIFLIWSMVTERNEVTRGTGQVIPSMGIQPVQSVDGGIIRKIYVRENQEVQTDDLLAEMSNVDALTGYQDLLNRQMEFKLALKRLDAEAREVPLQFTEEEKAAYPQAVYDQTRLYNTRREKYEGDGRELEANLAQKRSALEESHARKQQFEESLLLLKQQERKVRPLAESGRHPMIEYLNLKQSIIAQEGDLHSLAESISRIMSEVQEEESRLAGRKSQWEKAIAEESDEYRRQLNTVEQRLRAGGRAVEGNELRATMPGVIKRILLKEGAVAQRAETIMELLPTEDTLEVEARFRPADRAYLEPGQVADVQVDAYDSSIYGSLDARLISISPDTIEDTKGQPWYEVRLRTKTNRLTVDGQDLEIKAGMTVTVDVISGRKSIFDYLLKPILKSRHEGKAGPHSNGTGTGGESPGAALPQPNGKPEPALANSGRMRAVPASDSQGSL